MTDDLFIKKTQKAKSSYEGLPVIHLVGVAPKNGEIGIEIEVEGNKFPKGSGHELEEGDRHKIPKAWKFTHDGSLRGEDNAEYVLAKPLKFTEVEKALTDLWQMFSDYGSVLTESNRTSVHVHLNVQNFHLNRLCSFVAMYFVMEDLLTSWCGDHRVGNLFCLRAKDAPVIVRKLKEFFNQDGHGYQFSSGMHYAGLNPSAIQKFGSVEIRSLRGVNDPQIILDWVSVLQRIYERSADFKDPREVVAGFSGNGPIAWLENLLGDKFPVIMNNVPYSTDQVRDILYEGIRLAQDLCYCRDWSQYEERNLEQDPFNRVQFPSTGATTSSASNYSFYVPSSSVTSQPYISLAEDAAIKDKILELVAMGTMTTTLRSALFNLSATDRKTWMVSNGYWSVSPEVIDGFEVEDFEDDYYEED